MCRDARHFVRVLFRGQGDDLRHPVAASVPRHPALDALADVTAPSADGLDRSEAVRRVVTERTEHDRPRHRVRQEDLDLVDPRVFDVPNVTSVLRQV